MHSDFEEAPLTTLDQVRSFVLTRLAELDDLDGEAFPLTERVVNRDGKPCGLSFCLHGPRSMQLTAVWDVGRRQIVFYNSHGDRTRRCRLTKSPPAEELIRLCQGSM